MCLPIKKTAYKAVLSGVKQPLINLKGWYYSKAESFLLEILLVIAMLIIIL